MSVIEIGDFKIELDNEGYLVNYADYKSLDTDGDCRVRILPDCNISDM